MTSVRTIRATSRRAGLSLLASLLLGASGIAVAAPANAGKGTPKSGDRGHHGVLGGPVASPRVASEPLQQAENVPPQPTGSALAATTTSIDLKVLVLAADGSEADLPAIVQALDYLGTPYDLYRAAPVPVDPAANRFADPDSGAPQLVEGELGTSVRARYQGVILTTGGLGYASAGSYPSALTPGEWTYLRAFEARFGIRQLSWYTYPTPDEGFTYPTGAVDTTTSPLAVPFTAAGASVFSTYANTATPLTIKNAYAYLAQPLDAATTPLLSDAQGNALAAIRTYPDAREDLALTFDSNPYVLHDLVLSYGLVSWVTKGLFLGERHVFLSAQVDDVLIDNTVWPVGTACGTSVDDPNLPVYRMTAADLRVAQRWQAAKQQQATTKGFRLNLAYNGLGATPDYYANYRTRAAAATGTEDSLVPQVRSTQAKSAWISHTFDHADLDDMSYADAQVELQENDVVARSLGLSTYSKKNLVQPLVSGLGNSEFLRAAHEFGVRDLVSDTSRGGTNTNPSPNAGVYNALQPEILQVPRRPNNLYFNVSTPEEWLAEDNCLYPVGAFGHVDTYDQLLERESDVLFTYLVKGDINPWMFHQTNLRAYDGTRSLLSDLLDRTLAKYGRSFTLPVLSPTMDDLAGRVAQRMERNAAGVTAALELSSTGASSVTVSAPFPATAALTGVATPQAEIYGGQPIASVPLSAGEQVTLRPTLRLSPGSLTFSGQKVGTVSAPSMVTVSNASALPLAIAIASVATTGDFTQTNDCGGTVQAGRSCTISVNFRPTSKGSRSGTLTVTDASGSLQTVALKGTGG